MKMCDKSLFARDLRNRPIVIDRFLKNEIDVRQAAARLELSCSYTYKLAQIARTDGAGSLAYLKKRGKPPKRFEDSYKEFIRNLYINYENTFKKKGIKPFSFTLFNLILKNEHKVDISYSALHKLFSDSGKVSPYAHRRKKKGAMHSYRERRAQEGELWLADGSPHHWFGGAEEQCIHIVQDDATGKITGLYMTRNECFFGYAEAFKMGFKKFGIPENIASDLVKVLFNSKKQKDNLSIEDQLAGVEEKKTQMGHILEDKFGVELHKCYCPESKGRVEKAGGTLQGRLPCLFALRGICDIESANKFLESYIDEFNAEFAVQAMCENDVYAAVPNDVDLTEVFSIRHDRKTDEAGVFSFHKYKFRVKSAVKDVRLKRVRIYLNTEWGMKVKISGKFYDVELLQLDANKKALGREQIKLPAVWKDLFEKYLFFDAKKESPYHLAC